MTLVWFWILQPAQNPWYLVWALPFLPWVRIQSWHLVSGLVLAYYLILWFAYHQVAIASYRGKAAFDYVIVWFEHMPYLALIAAEWLWRRAKVQQPGD